MMLFSNSVGERGQDTDGWTSYPPSLAGPTVEIQGKKCPGVDAIHVSLLHDLWTECQGGFREHGESMAVIIKRALTFWNQANLTSDHGISYVCTSHPFVNIWCKVPPILWSSVPRWVSLQTKSYLPKAAIICFTKPHPEFFLILWRIHPWVAEHTGPGSPVCKSCFLGELKSAPPPAPASNSSHPLKSPTQTPSSHMTALQKSSPLHYLITLYQSHLLESVLPKSSGALCSQD